MKVCNRCKIEKQDKEFRWRFHKKKGGSKYLNNNCRKCDSEIQSLKYHSKLKYSPEFIEKNRKRMLNYVERNRAIILLKKKKIRETEEYKQYRKTYTRKNKKRIQELNKIRNVRYVRKMIEHRPMEYAYLKLKEQTGLKIIPPELVEAKNIYLQITRKIKQNDKTN